MKNHQKIRFDVEKLEAKLVLSTGLAPHLPAQPAIATAAVDVARPLVKLLGFVDYGTGVVSPLGGVSAVVNARAKVITLFNGAGTVKVKMTQVHNYYHTITARAYKIMNGTGAYRSVRGQGRASVTLLLSHGKVAPYWSASFYA